jgi:two-component system nitrogen regulation response regulator NtrX
MNMTTIERAAELPLPPLEAANEPAKKKKILIVDDDASVRESLAKVLREAGYEVAIAGDSDKALEIFLRAPIDLLLLDLGLPTKSGWEVFERMTRENPLLPVIIITGQANQYNVAVAAGVGALIEKPLDVLQLLQSMQELLAESKRTRLRRLVGQHQDVRYIPNDNSSFLRKLRDQANAPYHFAPIGHKEAGN